MAVDDINPIKYGIRFYSTQKGGGGRPACFEGIIASNYQIMPSQDVGLSVGDPVGRLPDGTYELAQNSLDTLSRFYGVIMGFSNIRCRDGRCYPGSYLPNKTVYTREQHATRVLIAPFSDHIWEVDGLAPGATTLADYRDLEGTNAEIQYLFTSEPPDKPQANPYVSLNGLVVPGLTFRVVGISGSAANIDFSDDFIKVLVQLNQGADPMIGPDGTDGL